MGFDHMMVDNKELSRVHVPKKIDFVTKEQVID